jgi:hypothetical protein
VLRKNVTRHATSGDQTPAAARNAGINLPPSRFFIAVALRVEALAAQQPTQTGNFTSQRWQVPIREAGVTPIFVLSAEYDARVFKKA